MAVAPCGGSLSRFLTFSSPYLSSASHLLCTGNVAELPGSRLIVSTAIADPRLRRIMKSIASSPKPGKW
jgi:hypothetical protein